MLKPTKTPDAEDLRKNMLSTYFFLRTGIVAMAAALPIALLAYSFFRHGALEEHSMSAFYGAYNGDMRNWFVGTLCALGAFLVLYKGFSFAEGIALNAAGMFAILTAFRPCNCWDGATTTNGWHATFAISFFASMAVVCFFCAKTTITLLPDQQTEDAFRRRYNAIGLALVLSPLAAVLFSYVVRSAPSSIFFIEWFGVWVFAFYWFTKTQEFQITAAEKKALRGHLQYQEGVGLVDVTQPPRADRRSSRRPSPPAAVR